jgi:hypothetical protein
MKNKTSKKNRLILRFLTYQDIKDLNSEKRIKIILDNVLENKIVILQGKLEPVEEASLIQSTMALIGRVKGFQGVELATIQPEKQRDFWEIAKNRIAQALVGHRDALTVIGPASVVKDIRKDPRKIDLLLKR